MNNQPPEDCAVSGQSRDGVFYLRQEKRSGRATLFGGLLLLLFLCATPLHAAVVFSFDYAAAPDFHATSKASLESVGTTFGEYFNHTATIDIEVTSSNADIDTLASAGSEVAPPWDDGFNLPGVVARKILGESDPNGASADGSVDVNFFHNWDFDDDVSGSAFDFKSTMLHELMHAVGFSSWIWPDGTDAFYTPAGNPATWGPFDKFLVDSTGRLINPTTFALDAARWNVASVGGTGTDPPTVGLYFDGPAAKAANGGSMVPIYSPNPWNQGSSGSHTDTDVFVAPNVLLMNHSVSTGPGVRTLSNIELGVLSDLGFSMVPEPASVLLIAIGSVALMGCGRWRR